MTASLRVQHNIEVAHRLSLLPGKCEAIHGHSMWVHLELWGQVDETGLLQGLDFGEVKRAYRKHLDTAYDHRLLLNEKDPVAKLDLPGLRVCYGDPTTENIARWVAEWAAKEWPDILHVRVVVDATHVNSATHEGSR